MIYFYKYKSALGEIYLAEEDSSLVRLSFRSDDFFESLGKIYRRTDFLDACFEEILQYLQGERETFSFQYEIRGSAFQREVYQALEKIPYGETRTYQEVAESIKRPRACRAVGNALNKNPLLLVLACHRVLAKNKGISGYKEGWDLKLYLLNLEKR